MPEETKARVIRARRRRKNANPEKRRASEGTPNPIVSCGCGCGGTFPKYSDLGRPRRFLPGHFSATPGERPGQVQGRVLDALRRGIEAIGEIAEDVGTTKNSVSIMLTKLRAAGKAEPSARGRWRLTGAPAAAPAGVDAGEAAAAP